MVWIVMHSASSEENPDSNALALGLFHDQSIIGRSQSM
jgi:hypothetical protein